MTNTDRQRFSEFIELIVLAAEGILDEAAEIQAHVDASKGGDVPT